MSFSKKRIGLCFVLSVIYMVAILYQFYIIKDWTRIGMASICGATILIILCGIFFNNVKIDKIMCYGICCLMIVGIVEATMFVFNVNNISTTFRYARITDAFKSLTYRDYFLTERMEREAKTITDSCKDYAVFKNYLSETVFFSVFKDKEVYVQNEIKNDYRTRLLTGSIRYHTIRMDYISPVIGRLLMENQQKECIEIEYKNAESKKIYLINTNEWGEFEKLYVMADNESNNIVIPELLLQDDSGIDYKGDKFTRFEEANSNDISKILWTSNGESFLLNLKGIDGTNVSMNGFIYLIYLTFLGYIYLAFSYNIPARLMILLSLPFGVIIEIVSCIALGLFHIPLSMGSLIFMNMVGSIAIPCAWNKDVLKRFGCLKHLKIKNILLSRDAIVYLFLLIAVYAFFCYVPIWHTSGDSLRNISLAWRMVYRQEWGSLFSIISAYSLFMPFISTGSVLFQADTPYYILPCLSLVSMMAIGNIVYSGSHCLWEWLVIILAIGFVIITPMVILNSVWIMNNLPVGLYIGIALALILSDKKFDSQYILGGIIFVFACCIRIEMPLYGVLALLIIDQIVERKIIKQYAWVLLLSTFSLYVLNYIYFNPSRSDFWTPMKGIVVLSMVFFLVIFSTFRRWISEKFKMVYDYRIMLMQISMILTPIVFSLFIDYKKMMLNFDSYWQNTIYRGYFGFLWLIIGFLLIFVLTTSIRTSKSLVMAEILFMTFMFGIDIMCFRKYPITSSYGDSSARMLLHVLPSVALFIVYLVEDCIKSLKFNTVIKKI